MPPTPRRQPRTLLPSDTCLAQGLHTKVVEVPPQPLTAQLLARIPELSTDSAQQLLQLFTAAGVTDQQGMLVEDPRSAGWHKVVQNSGIPGAALQPTNVHVEREKPSVCHGMFRHASLSDHS
jgi:hypothetical protein